MKYSIITATYNAETFLERLLASILSQSYPNFEWVVQDGGSTDNTLNILKKYPDVRIKIQSEPDRGIYDAWNKAVARARRQRVISQCCRGFTKELSVVKKRARPRHQ
jgi:glycosyltransferase involved in cell wall biosynthesis